MKSNTGGSDSDYSGGFYSWRQLGPIEFTAGTNGPIPLIYAAMVTL